MKKLNFILILLTLFFSKSVFSQMVKATFSADNCYSVYLGNDNQVNTKVLPSEPNIYGVYNTRASQIFTPETNTVNLSEKDPWYYVCAWSDDNVCQGLIGEFIGSSTLKTGDKGWQVYATNKNYNNGQAPDKNEVNKYIALANQTNGWEVPYVGPTNANSNQTCKSYRKVNGISDDAKWVWYDSDKLNSNKVFNDGENHKEFLIFRFHGGYVYPTINIPINIRDWMNTHYGQFVNAIQDSLSQFQSNTNDNSLSSCFLCPPTNSNEISSQFKVSTIGGGNMEIKMNPTPQFVSKMNAYFNLLKAVYPGVTDLSTTWNIRKNPSQSAITMVNGQLSPPYNKNATTQYLFKQNSTTDKDFWVTFRGGTNCEINPTNFFTLNEPLKINTYYRISMCYWMSNKDVLVQGPECRCHEFVAFIYMGSNSSGRLAPKLMLLDENGNQIK